MISVVEVPESIWIEMHDPAEQDACDVIVKMENGGYYTAMFVTLPFLSRQMELSYEVSKELPYTTPIHYAVFETPHVLVSDLTRDTIEDTIDNLLALDVFENLFTRVTEEDEDEVVSRTRDKGKRATTEVAAVVVSEVLKAQGDPLPV